MLPIWNENFAFQGWGYIIQWIIVTPAILSITENGNGLSFRLQKWPLNTSFTKSGLFCYRFADFFNYLCSSVYPVPGVIFISSSTYYLNIINMLKMVIVPSSFFALFCRESLLRELSGGNWIFLYLAQALLELCWSMRSCCTK